MAILVAVTLALTVAGCVVGCGAGLRATALRHKAKQAELKYQENRLFRRDRALWFWCSMLTLCGFGFLLSSFITAESLYGVLAAMFWGSIFGAWATFTVTLIRSYRRQEQW